MLRAVELVPFGFQITVKPGNVRFKVRALVPFADAAIIATWRMTISQKAHKQQNSNHS